MYIKNIIFNKLILISILVFLISFILSYSPIDFSSNASVATGHVYTAKSIALSGNYNVDEYKGVSGADVIKVGKQYYTPYAPLNPLLMAIPYYIQHRILYRLSRDVIIDKSLENIIQYDSLALINSLVFAFTFYLLFKYYLQKNPTKIQILLLTSITFGTTLFTYSLSYFNHNLSALFILLSVIVLSGKNKFKYVFAGMFTGFSFLSEFPTILFAIPVLFSETYLLFNKKINVKQFLINLIVFSIPVLFSITCILIFNKYHFGNYFTFGEFLFKEQRTIKNGSTFSFNQNLLFGLYGITTSPLKGLFFYSPFLIFTIPKIKEYTTKYKYEAFLVIGYILTITFVYALWNDCFGATTFGNRYIISTLPLWGIILLRVYKPIKSKILLIILFVLCFISILNISFNSILGIADSKFGKCENINAYNPYLRIKENYIDKSPKTAPVIFKAIRSSTK